MRPARLSYSDIGRRDGRLRGYMDALRLDPSDISEPGTPSELPQEEYQDSWRYGWSVGYREARHCEQDEVPKPPDPPEGVTEAA